MRIGYCPVFFLQVQKGFQHLVTSGFITNLCLYFHCCALGGYRTLGNVHPVNAVFPNIRMHKAGRYQIHSVNQTIVLVEVA